MKGTVMYDAPRVMFFRQKSNALIINKDTCFGETSQSWLCGSAWRPKEFLRKKSDYDLATEQEYVETRWIQDHASKIAKMIHDTWSPTTPKVDYAVLRKVAELIGYEEGK